MLCDSRLRLLLLDEVRLDGLVLRVEVGHVNDKVPDHKHVRQRGDLGDMGGVAVDLAQAGEAVLPINVHRAASTDTLPAAIHAWVRRVVHNLMESAPIS